VDKKVYREYLAWTIVMVESASVEIPENARKMSDELKEYLMCQHEYSTETSGHF